MPPKHRLTGFRLAVSVFRLAYFEGTWTLAGEAKPSPLGPGGKFTETERNKWMEGNFFLISHVQFTGSMGTGIGLSIMGFDTNERQFTFDSYNSQGEVEHAKGNLDHGTWSFTSAHKMNSKQLQERFSIKEVSPTSYSFKLDIAPEGGQFETVMQGTATKQP